MMASRNKIEFSIFNIILGIQGRTMNHIKLAKSIQKFSTNLHSNFQLSPTPETGSLEQH